MLDHITIDVADLDASGRFYDEALRPLGITRLYAFGQDFIGYGSGKKAFFWIGRRGETPTRTHIAFAAPDRATVDRYFAAAIAAGGREDAFVLDPDGNNVEAVCHLPPEAD
jgi:catechol 2,3-dioxygenase-like lactoylglutathione lyase family enzyme